MPVPKEPFGPTMPEVAWSWHADDGPVITATPDDADAIITAAPLEEKVSV